MGSKTYKIENLDVLRFLAFQAIGLLIFVHYNV
jgi:hypothetical protein